MKRKAVLWMAILLLNAAIGIVSFKAYQSTSNRITGIETRQNSYDEKYDKGLELLRSDFQKKSASSKAELLAILGVDGKYDFNGILINKQDLNKFLNYRVNVKTSLVLEIPSELRESNTNIKENSGEVTVEAPAIVIGRYVLMASHVSDAEFLRRQAVKMSTPFGILEKVYEFKILKYSVELLLPDGSKYPLKELYRSREGAGDLGFMKDFCLFEMPKNAKAPNFPFKIGDSSELLVGNFIYLNGQPKIRSEIARPGFVTSLTVAFRDKGGVGRNNYEFSLSQSTDHGDSGSPVIAFRDGKPELVGIYLGWITAGVNDNGANTRSRALRINNAIKEIKEKLGLDLRELQRLALHK